MTPEARDSGIWRTALGKTVRFLPAALVIALIPMALDGPSAWTIAELLTAAIVTVACVPIVVVLFAFVDWLP